VYLQVPSLDDVTVQGDAEWTDYDGLGGQFSIPGAGPRLKTVELRTMTIFTFFQPEWVDLQSPPFEIAANIELLRENLSPFRALLYFQGGPGTFLDLPVAIRSLTKTTKFGEVDTIYYDMSLTEWRRPLVQSRSTGTSRAPGGGILPTTHKLTSSDTFESLSERYYGNRDGARAIASANGISNWGLRTPLIQRHGMKAGTVIKIPKIAGTDVFVQGTGRAA
jgi:nucleoid-associated protein YgaU